MSKLSKLSVVISKTVLTHKPQELQTIFPVPSSASTFVLQRLVPCCPSRQSAFYVPIVRDNHLIPTSVHLQLAQRPGLNVRRFLTLFFRVGGETEIKSLFLLFIPGAKVLMVSWGLFDKACKPILMFPIRQQLRCWIFYVCL